LMVKKIIYTLDARDHAMLEVMRDYFNLPSKRMRNEIQGMLAETQKVLSSKDIKYGDLKSAHVPNPKRREIALVFDTSVIEESWYSLPIHTTLMPLFSKRSNHSILVGDYIGDNEHQERLYEAFFESVQLVRDVTWRHSTQFYIVYINNLTDKMVETFRTGLIGFEPYVGFSDTTFASRFKLFLSTMLVNECLKHRDIILVGHEDDRDNSEDVNMRSYPWEEFGYTCRSLQGIYFGVLLSYKIERPVFKGFEVDSEFSINAVHSDPVSFTDFEIEIDEHKFAYLAAEKSGTLKRMGLLGSDLTNLKKLIASKISSNYIYNMTHDDQHDTTKFNIILEVNPEDGSAPLRVLAALEYMPRENCLRLITLH